MHRGVSFHCTIPAPWGDGFVLPESIEGANRIATALAAHVDRVDPVSQHESYGWGFQSQLGDCTFYNVVNPITPDEWWLTASLDGAFWRKITLKKPTRDFDRYCERVTQALSSIREISRVQWEAGYR